MFERNVQWPVDRMLGLKSHLQKTLRLSKSAPTVNGQCSQTGLTDGHISVITVELHLVIQEILRGASGGATALMGKAVC